MNNADYPVAPQRYSDLERILMHRTLGVATIVAAAIFIMLGYLMYPFLNSDMVERQHAENTINDLKAQLNNQKTLFKEQKLEYEEKIESIINNKELQAEEWARLKQDEVTRLIEEKTDYLTQLERYRNDETFNRQADQQLDRLIAIVLRKQSMIHLYYIVVIAGLSAALVIAVIKYCSLLKLCNTYVIQHIGNYDDGYGKE